MKDLSKIRILIFTGIFVMSAPAATLHAQQQSLTVSWKPVREAYGYVVQIRKKDGSVDESESKTPESF